MTHLKLRFVDRRTVRMRRAVAYWHAQELPVTLAPVDRIGRYLAFRALAPSGDWQGLIAIDDWLSSVAPSLARLAAGRGHQEQVMRLFAASWQMLELPRELSPSSLTVGGLVEGAELPHGALPCITTAQAKVWLQTLPEILTFTTAAVTPGLRDFPVPLQFELGTSHISTSLLSRLMIGDALLISHAVPRISSQGKTLGRYVWTKEGIIVDQLQENHEDELLDADDTSINAVAEEAGDANVVPKPSNGSLRSVAQVPVRLEFMLDKKLITVGELGQLSAGQLIELTPGVEKHIAVSANGVLLGHGELIQLDDQLAVEIHQLYDGSPHA